MPDKANQSFQLINANIEVVGAIIPHFGFVAYPWKGLYISGTTHLDSASGTVTLENHTQISGMYGEETSEGQNEYDKKAMISSFKSVYGFLPMRFSTGMGYLFEHNGYKFGPVVNANLSLWSYYINRHGEKPADAWKNSFSFSTGFHMRSDARQVGFDFAYVPSPVPEQTGRENYIDNDRMSWALGWTEFFKIGKMVFAGGLNFQIQWMMERTTWKDLNRKEQDGGLIDEFPDTTLDANGDPFVTAKGLQTNNPGFPGFKSGGVILGSGISFTLLY